MDDLSLKFSAVEKSYKQAPMLVRPYLLPLLELVRELVKREIERSKS